jgi:aspartate/methionine/tyrosine aminotransferase
MINNRLDRLSEYPFTRLTRLLADIPIRSNHEPIVMSLGEPQHEPPALIDEVLRRHAHLWSRYPPAAGTPEFRAAIGEWLTRGYRLPSGLLDPDRSVLPVAGTREALFLAGLLAVPDAGTAARRRC